MKTSVIDVRDMLSVLSVLGVEERIGEVPGVDSVTVNFSAGSATVRYDETRLDVADIKSGVRQRSYEADAESAAAAEEGHANKAAAGEAPAVPESAASKTPAVAPAAASVSSAGAAPQEKVAPPATPKTAPDAAAAAAVPTAGVGHEQHDKAAPGKA